MSSANETQAGAETREHLAGSDAEPEAAAAPGDLVAAAPADGSSRTGWIVVVVALAVTIAATLAIIGAGLTQGADQRQQEHHRAAQQAAAEWLTLLLTLPNDPRAGNAQMEQMKRTAADPLRSRFEDSMSVYFQDYAPWADRAPLQITSVSLLDAGTLTEAHQPNPMSTTVLLTTTADPVRSHGGHGFWADVVNQGGQYLVADFGPVS